MDLIKGLNFGFNTQPPEGGWLYLSQSICRLFCFNTQPPEGGWQRLGQFQG